MRFRVCLRGRHKPFEDGYDHDRDKPELIEILIDLFS